ncbi:hypothetical protein [Micromonospora sp. NPDC047527]|uniref:hypothetical protein n=1 Tax=unclassified Micromonospora TaxID=2617518 RepID=UPI00340707C2
MTSLGAGLTTETPTLLIVADLGDMPRLSQVKRYVDQLDRVGCVGEAVGRFRATRGNHPRLSLAAQMRVVGNPSLHVARMRLESPFEVVLTTVAEQFSPVAYGVAGIAAMERIVRLIMDWQKHRMEILEGASPRVPRPLVGPEQIARETVDQAYEGLPGVSDEELVEAIEAARQPIELLSRVRLTRIESSGTGR